MKFGGAISDFFRDIGNFFRGGAVIGVDIGTTSIKALELKKKGDVFSVASYGLLETKDYLDHPNQAIQTSSLKLSPTDAAAALSLLMRDMKPASKLCVASLPSFTTFATTLDFPMLSPEETAKAVGFQAAQYVPLPLSEVSLEWRKVGEYADKDGGKHQRILLVAVPNDVVKAYEEVFKRAGLKLVALEPEAFAMARALQGSLTEAPTVVLDIGAVSSVISIVRAGDVQYVTQTDYSGVYLTQALSRSLEISMSRAEELKRRRGLAGTGAESELSTILLPFLDVIIQEVKRAKDSYEKLFGVKAEKLSIVGGGASLLGLERYVSAQTGFQIGHHSYTSGIAIPQGLVPVMKDLENRFALTYGLARRYFS